MTFKIQSIEDWDQALDSILLEFHYPILLLKGNLGAGKTTFTKELLVKLGSTNEVSSPTYSIVNEYDTPKGKVFHFDLYRLKNIEEVYDIGMEDYLRQGVLSIIEWPEVYEEDLLGLPYHILTITKQDETRHVEFSTIE